MNHLTRGVLAFGIPFLVIGWAPVPTIPEKLDILGMIRQIYANNDGINSTNNEIVGNMKQINHLAGTTSRIGQQLTTLQQGLGEQDASLVNLNVLSQRQIELSDSLHKLANTLDHDLILVQQGSAGQSGSIQEMLETTRTLSRLAQEITTVNGTIAGKLDRAAKTTAEVVNSMP
jgi:hypothetical protein